MSAAAIAAVIVGIACLDAGASKRAAREQWAVQARDLGAPHIVVPVLPWIELVIGAALVVQFARTAVAIAAGVLLVVFTALIALRLSQGRRPACACFGAWSAKPIGAGHLLRNTALLALAAVAAFG